MDFDEVGFAKTPHYSVKIWVNHFYLIKNIPLLVAAYNYFLKTNKDKYLESIKKQAIFLIYNSEAFDGNDEAFLFAPHLLQ